jgi:DNA-binding CsgD family transcriptional regulator
VTQNDGDRRIPTPVVVLHPSASFRRGLSGPLHDRSLALTAAPTDLAEWLAGTTTRAVVIGDGTQAALIPLCGDSSTAIVLVGELEVGAYRRALAAGAHGVAHIDADPETIALVVQSAVAGEVVIPAEIARRLAGRAQPADLQLSAEEIGMLQRLSDGATVVQLADELYLAERSVRRRLQNVYIRLGVPGRAAALKRASQLGLVD